MINLIRVLILLLFLSCGDSNIIRNTPRVTPERWFDDTTEGFYDVYFDNKLGFFCNPEYISKCYPFIGKVMASDSGCISKVATTGPDNDYLNADPKYVFDGKVGYRIGELKDFDNLYFPYRGVCRILGAGRFPSAIKMEDNEFGDIK